MCFGQLMFKRFDDARGGDRSCYKRDANRLKTAGRQRLCRKSRPKTMPIARDRRKACNPMGPNEVVDLATFHKGAAVVASAETRISSTRPTFAITLREILRIGTHIQCRCRIAPDLPI